ncbi:hypothetical protein A2U01_0037095 [Trifolium medium]|uniref:Uncharacterized protein n=1 Tax=Trifolium medium TaxID=97028 RepID=A0A392PYA9_9FABA|nr:hypothetical protein [Trifolium medium]
MAFLNMVGMFRHLLASDHPFIQAVTDTKIKRDTSMAALADQVSLIVHDNQVMENNLNLCMDQLRVVDQEIEDLLRASAALRKRKRDILEEMHTISNRLETRQDFLHTFEKKKAKLISKQERLFNREELVETTEIQLNEAWEELRRFSQKL